MNPSKAKEIEMPLLKKDPLEASFGHMRLSQNKSLFPHVLNIEPQPQFYNNNSGFCSRIFYLDTFSYIKQKRYNKIEELPCPYNDLAVEKSIADLDDIWEKERLAKKPSFLNAIWKLYKPVIKTKLFWLLVTVVIQFLNFTLLSYIMKQILLKTMGEYIDSNYVYKLAAVYSFFELVVKLMLSNFLNSNQLIACNMKNTISGMLYKKIHSTSTTFIKNQNAGKVINLMGSNLNEIELGVIFLVPAFISPFVIVLGTFFMWLSFGEFALVSIGIQILIVIFSHRMGKWSAEPKAILNNTTDNRIKITKEIIESIRLIKLYCWGKAFKNMAEVLRSKEVDSLLKFLRIQFYATLLSTSSVHICIFGLCSFYTYYGEMMSPEKVYTALLILNFINFWGMTTFQMGISFYYNLKNLAFRAQEVLLIPDIISGEEYQKNSNWRSLNNITIPPIIFRNYFGYWIPGSNNPCLEDINLKLMPGTITAIIGKVGSGKSSFLSALLREIPDTRGELSCKGSIAYVGQESVIFTGTIRENIVFGQHFDQSFYEKVLKICRLESDLAELPFYDMCIVGEKGVTLSGGQQARIGLARAIYSNSDVYLLDDPFSALDAKVADSIWENVIKNGPLKSKIVIFTTHHVDYARKADKVILFNEGSISSFCSPEYIDEEVFATLSYKSNHNQDHHPSYHSESHNEDPKSKIIYHSTRRKMYKPVTEDVQNITWDDYKAYLQSSGHWPKIKFILAIYFLSHLFVIGFLRFIGYWAYKEQLSYREGLSTEEIIGQGNILIAGILLLLILVSKFMKAIVLRNFVLENNTAIHQMMIKKIIRATISYFDLNTIGHLLSRFSSDLGACDKDNFKFFNDGLEGISSFAMFIITICLISPLTTIPAVIIIYFLNKIKAYFAEPMLITRSLDLQSRSPLFSEIAQSVYGLHIIRTFRQGPAFIRKYLDLIYRNSKAFEFQQRTMRSFLLSIDMAVYVLVVSSLFIYIYVAFNTNFDPSLFSLGISLALQLLEQTGYILRTTIRLDQNMQNAKRMQELERIPEEAPDFIPNQDNPLKMTFNKWPAKGEVTFKNVYLKYREDNVRFALNGISFTIPAGSKVGIVGRTGAGKSSIVQALFRLYEIDNFYDSKIMIDGVDISTIGLDLLRSSIAIIPQSSMLFDGTVRRNIDPLGEYKQDEIMQALTNVGLRDYIETLPKGLETEIMPGKAWFSSGQKQLFCLARALLKGSKIIVMDESTSNVDIATEKVIITKINQYFKDATVITIAHRLITIANYDTVMVLDKGKVIEFDHPYKLLTLDPTDQLITNPTLFASMVKKTGNNLAKFFFDISRESFFKRTGKRRNSKIIL